MTTESAVPTRWRNRIVRTGMMPPDQLLAHPDNARIHPLVQMETLEGLLDDLGWTDFVKLQDGTDIVHDGHARVALALKHDEPLVPVAWTDLDDDEVRKALATFDSVTGLAAWDRQKLDDLLREVTSPDSNVQTMLSDLWHANGGPVDEKPPSLDDLEAEFGEPDPVQFWPVLTLKLKPETYERYQEIIQTFPGAIESDRFAALLDQVDA